MIELTKPLVLYLVAGAVAWFAGRYHVDAQGQQQLSTDIMGGFGVAAATATGLWAHWRAYVTVPPPAGPSTPKI